MRFIEIPRDDIPGAVDGHPAALLKNTSGRRVSFELQQKPPRENPRFNKNGASHLPRGGRFEIDRVAGGLQNPRMLFALYETRDPATGAPVFVPHSNPQKPAPLLVLQPGEEILVDAQHVFQIIRTQCLDCGATIRRFACTNESHARQVIGGLAVGLVVVDEEGEEVNIPVHPTIANQGAPPPVLVDDSMHAQVLRFMAEKKAAAARLAGGGK
jgi:hypothetical protein